MLEEFSNIHEKTNQLLSYMIGIDHDNVEMIDAQGEVKAFRMTMRPSV